ncbi:hypothetical protein BHM03_00063005 [Ensete ventricosum]|nr:hypothetical protein BHM03_00063005 [Ensete ventricosum]
MILYYYPRFAISTYTARYGRYVPIRQVTSTRTARYRAVPSKIDRRRSIEEEKGKKRGRKNTSPARRPRPPVVAARGRLRAVAARGHGRFFSRTRRRSVSPRGETDRGDVAPFSSFF